VDESVRAALAKWPNVPHAYGWLRLDARGRWLIKDSPIVNEALTAFIQRNYLHDAAARWFFQNGPQRVYCALDAAPYVLSITNTGALVAHDGVVVEAISAAYMDRQGRLFVGTSRGPAMLDDRTLASISEAIVADAVGNMRWNWAGQWLPITVVDDAATVMGFDRSPMQPVGDPEC
jgi:ligand-binding sensor domain-containing protein